MNDVDTLTTKSRRAEIKILEVKILQVNKWLLNNIHHKDWEKKTREYNNLVIKRDAVEDDIERIKGRYRNVEIMNSICINPNYNLNGRH
jgi:hypothetical protein